MMSLRIDFTFLDKNGILIYKGVVGSANYTDDLQSLNFLHKVLKDHLTHPMMIHRKEIKYAVPDTFELLPNKFERRNKS